MLIFCSARIPLIRDRMPIREKSSTPWIRKALQPSSRAMVCAGTSFVSQTREISSSVHERKKNPVFLSISVSAATWQTDRSRSMGSIRMVSSLFVPLHLTAAPRCPCPKYPALGHHLPVDHKGRGLQDPVCRGQERLTLSAAAARNTDLSLIHLPYPPRFPPAGPDPAGSIPFPESAGSSPERLHPPSRSDPPAPSPRGALQEGQGTLRRSPW